MAMNLLEWCAHCGAPPNIMCSENCSANGKKIMALKKALRDLDLEYERHILSELTRHKKYKIEPTCGEGFGR